MKRKKGPMDNLDVEDKDAKAKVSLVLTVLSGEKSIAEACRETGFKPILYYKLEERMVRAMVATAAMPALRGRRKDPLVEATSLAQETEQLRQEHRRLQSLMRISKKLLRKGARRGRKPGPGRPKGSTAPLAEGTEPARRPGRPPLHPVTQA
jgi:transposase-like protein